MTPMIEGVALETDYQARKLKLVYAVVMLALCAGCVVLVSRFGFFPGIGAFIFGVSGVLVLLAALTKPTGRGPCPTCGTPLSDVAFDAESVPCPSCGDYAMVRAGRLVPTPVDHVASSSIYTINLEPGQQLHALTYCVACGQHATRTGEQGIRKPVVGVPGVGRVVRTWHVVVPACDVHATTDTFGNYAGAAPSDGRLAIRSYRAWRAAVGRA